jgi:hypothetical protein
MTGSADGSIIRAISKDLSVNALFVFLNNALVANSTCVVYVGPVDHGIGIFGTPNVVTSVAIVADGRKDHAASYKDRTVHTILILFADIRCLLTRMTGTAGGWNIEVIDRGSGIGPRQDIVLAMAVVTISGVTGCIHILSGIIMAVRAGDRVQLFLVLVLYISEILVTVRAIQVPMN